MNPKVSILLTCYNHMRYLPAAVQSIKEQTYRDFEIIAIDDGSMDETRHWLANNSDGIRVYFNKANLGTYGALNTGLALAKGSYIAVLNDDDVWAPRKLELQMKVFAENPNIGLVHTDGQFIDGEGKVVPGAPLGFEFPTTTTSGRDILLALLHANKIIASSVVVRRECFDKVGLFNDEYFGSGDWEMWLRIAEHYDIGCVPEKLTSYRVHGTNASHRYDKIWKDDEKLRTWLARRAELYHMHGVDAKALRNARAHNLACLGTVKKLNGKDHEARSAYLAAIRLNPFRAKSYYRLCASFLPYDTFRKTI